MLLRLRQGTKVKSPSGKLELMMETSQRCRRERRTLYFAGAKQMESRRSCRLPRKKWIVGCFLFGLVIRCFVGMTLFSPLFEGEEFSVVRNGIGRHNWKQWGIQLNTGEGRAGIGQEGRTEVGLSSLDSDAKLWTI